MKPRYYLARLMSSSLQFSDTYYSSYQKADNARARQVNPSHWFIIVNPILSPGRRINAEQTALEDAEKLRKAYKLIQEVVL